MNRSLLHFLSTLFCVVAPSVMLAQETPLPEFPPMTFINRIEYKESTFSRDTVGNSFLVKYNGKTYGVTAKHVLMLAKTDKMQSVLVNGELSRWIMYSKADAAQQVLVDKVLNENDMDSLSWAYIGRHRLNYYDWLVFSIRENKSKARVLEIRNSPLQSGELVYVIGWSYADKDGQQRVYEYSYVKEVGTHFYLRNVRGSDKPFGLSGSPVVDKNGLLVGIVSLSDRDPETKEIFLLPCKVTMLVEILADVKK